jgi:dTDP-4-dehydrorhamnose 3,5-epimerase
MGWTLRGAGPGGHDIPVIFSETPLKGVFIVDLERREDSRGFFARTWCEQEAAAHGLNTRVAQCNVSFTHRKGALRGMHFQLPPHQEARLVRCTMGSIQDTIIDLRADSPTFMQHWSAVLSTGNRRALYIPEGFAHGFQTLEDDTEVLYQMSAAYVPEASTGVRWNDAAFRIFWPLAVTDMSERDRSFPDFDPPGPFRSR